MSRFSLSRYLRMPPRWALWTLAVLMIAGFVSDAFAMLIAETAPAGVQALKAIGLLSLTWIIASAVFFLYSCLLSALLPQVWQMLKELWSLIRAIPGALSTGVQALSRLPQAVGRWRADWRNSTAEQKRAGLVFAFLLALLPLIGWLVWPYTVTLGGWLTWCDHARCLVMSRLLVTVFFSAIAWQFVVILIMQVMRSLLRSSRHPRA